MAADDERLFSERRIRRAGLASLVAGLVVPLAALGLGLFVRWLLIAHLGPLAAGGIGLLVGLVAAGAALDWLSLGWFNRRLRRQLVARLRRLGELDFPLDDPSVYFVGLAHPAKVTWRRWETDDEVGFLRLTFTGLEFRGDRLHFDVGFEAIEDLTQEPVGFGLPARFQRIRVRFVAGEPFDELLLCAREGDRLSAGNDVTRTLYEALVARWQRHGPRLREPLEQSAAESELTEEPRQDWR